jgi:hypothetical protein
MNIARHQVPQGVTVGKRGFFAACNEFGLRVWRYQEW